MTPGSDGISRIDGRPPSRAFFAARFKGGRSGIATKNELPVKFPVPRVYKNEGAFVVNHFPGNYANTAKDLFSKGKVTPSKITRPHIKELGERYSQALEGQDIPGSQPATDKEVVSESVYENGRNQLGSFSLFTLSGASNTAKFGPKGLITNTLKLGYENNDLFGYTGRVYQKPHINHETGEITLIAGYTNSASGNIIEGKAHIVYLTLKAEPGSYNTPEELQGIADRIHGHFQGNSKGSNGKDQGGSKPLFDLISFVVGTGRIEDDQDLSSIKHRLRYENSPKNWSGLFQQIQRQLNKVFSGIPYELQKDIGREIKFSWHGVGSNKAAGNDLTEEPPYTIDLLYSGPVGQVQSSQELQGRFTVHYSDLVAPFGKERRRREGAESDVDSDKLLASQDRTDNATMDTSLAVSRQLFHVQDPYSDRLRSLGNEEGDKNGGTQVGGIGLRSIVTLQRKNPLELGPSFVVNPKNFKTGGKEAYLNPAITDNNPDNPIPPSIRRETQELTVNRNEAVADQNGNLRTEEGVQESYESLLSQANQSREELERLSVSIKSLEDRTADTKYKFYKSPVTIAGIPLFVSRRLVERIPFLRLLVDSNIKNILNPALGRIQAELDPLQKSHSQVSLTLKQSAKPLGDHASLVETQRYAGMMLEEMERLQKVTSELLPEKLRVNNNFGSGETPETAINPNHIEAQNGHNEAISGASSGEGVPEEVVWETTEEQGGQLPVVKETSNPLPTSADVITHRGIKYTPLDGHKSLYHSENGGEPLYLDEEGRSWLKSPTQIWGDFVFYTPSIDPKSVLLRDSEGRVWQPHPDSPDFVYRVTDTGTEQMGRDGTIYLYNQEGNHVETVVPEEKTVSS